MTTGMAVSGRNVNQRKLFSTPTLHVWPAGDGHFQKWHHVV